MRAAYLILFFSLFLNIESYAFAAFTTVSKAQWNETAVRKVLHTFAFGGFASDAQIQTWADMPPKNAIAQILTFSTTNQQLSPAEDQTSLLLETQPDSTLKVLQEWWMSDLATNPMPAVYRNIYHPISADGLSFNQKSLQQTWISAATSRGINPFRQVVGLWLTNYLLSVHLHSVNFNHLLIRTMYDDMMRALGEGKPFTDVIAIGASSAALARQYGHMNNRMVNGEFFGNDDFGREFHQLIFGILGELPSNDPNRLLYKKYYEEVTVEGTARALTGMKLSKGHPYGIVNEVEVSDINFYSTDNQSRHHFDALEILNFNSPGNADTFGFNAKEKILNLSRLAIDSPESEAFLPVRIIQHFGDSTLSIQNDTDQRIIDIRESWILANKNLLQFLRDYAVSTQFHSAERIKYFTAFERNLIISNLNTLSNIEGNHQLSNPSSRMREQGAVVFEPMHFVFGGQTGSDAIDNPSIFKDAYNSNVNGEHFLSKASVINETTNWEKDWGAVISANANGEYIVNDVARWLWNRFITDNGKNYAIQERAYVSCMLAYGKDFTKHVSTQLNTTLATDGYSSFDLNDPAKPYLSIIQDCENQRLDLDNNLGEKISANLRIGMAVNFITATPFMFYSEGR